jgi:ribosomal protein L40E
MVSVSTIFLPRDAMPANRPSLTLDEQSFQGLLSAAYTIQQHNDRQKLARQTPARETQAEPEAHSEPEADRVCEHCGARMPAEASRCGSCGLDEFRPGERMQRNWASMWLRSQEQGLWPERFPEIREGPRTGVPPVAKEAAEEMIAREKTGTIHDRAFDTSALDKAEAKSQWITEATEDWTPEDPTPEDLTPEDLTPKELASEDAELTVPPFQLSTSDDSFLTDADASASSMIQRFWDLRVKLRFQRADLYLGAAICVAALALLWPAAGSPRRAALHPWEKALVTLGIAEAPAPAVHFQGDSGIEVWVDPHTALYYCPGEEQYGKTAGGRFNSQREAQMDRFEPAGRSACE